MADEELIEKSQSERCRIASVSLMEDVQEMMCHFYDTNVVRNPLSRYEIGFIENANDSMAVHLPEVEKECNINLSQVRELPKIIKSQLIPVLNEEKDQKGPGARSFANMYLDMIKDSLKSRRR